MARPEKGLTVTSFLELSSAERALGRHALWALVGEPWALWVRVGLPPGLEQLWGGASPTPPARTGPRSAAPSDRVSLSYFAPSGSYLIKCRQ